MPFFAYGVKYRIFLPVHRLKYPFSLPSWIVNNKKNKNRFHVSYKFISFVLSTRFHFFA